jgi:prepilin-type N-terminal cleavage/methylation domain-containing protein
MRSDRGFTLLELIISLVLLGLLTSILGMGLVAAMNSHEFTRSNTQLAQKAQLAIARITRELTELTEIEALSDENGGDEPFILYYRPSEGQEQAVKRMGMHYSPSDLRLLLYTDCTDSAPLSSDTADGADVLVDQVDSFSLSFFQGDTGMPWTWGNDFRLLSMIEVRLTLQRPENPDRTQLFSTMVHLRNTRNFGGATPANLPVSRDSYSCFIKAIDAD